MNEKKELLLKSISDLNDIKQVVLLSKIRTEIFRQLDKWNIQEHSFEKWYMILMEEILEITQEYLSTSNENIGKLFKIQKEIIESITILVQMYFGIENEITNRCGKIFIGNDNERTKKI